MIDCLQTGKEGKFMDGWGSVVARRHLANSLLWVHRIRPIERVPCFDTV